MLRLLMLFNAHRPRGRIALSVAGIALGVALGYAVHLVNRSAVEDVAAAVRSVAGEADVEVRGGRSGFAEALYPRIARLPGIRAVSPALELDVGIAGTEKTLRVIGLDILRAAVLQPALATEDRFELLSPDNVLLSAGAAAALGLEKGGALRVIVGSRAIELHVAGVLPASALRGQAALVDIATAQGRFGRLGELNRLDIRLAEHAERAALVQQIQALLPPGAHAAPVESLEQASAYPSRAYRVNLDVLAMVALFTGGFLVFSAQALETARRRSEHALLRVLGLQRRGVSRLILLEAAALGAIGAVLGLALGYGLAVTATRAFGGDLGAGQFRNVFPHVSFSPIGALVYFAAGIAVSVLGALLPARDAARTPAAQALKAGDEQEMFARASSPLPGLILLAAGALLAFLPAVNGLPLFGYASIACLLIGAIALMPRVSRALFDLLPLPRSPGLALALAQLRAAPGQAAVSLAAIVASFSLMAAMVIMVSSFRQSVDDWLGTVLPADLYFRTTHAGDTGFLEPSFVERVRSIPGIARVDFLRSGRVMLDPSRPPLVLIARDHAERAFPLVAKTPSVPAHALWVSEAVKDIYGLAPGMTVQLPLLGKSYPFAVAGVFRDYARQHGALLLDRADYAALTGDQRVNDGALWLTPDATPASVMEALRALPGGEQLDMGGSGEIRKLSLGIFDRSFAITYAMEAVAVLVGLFGLSSSLGAVVLARRREFGMLRHLGLTRGQIRRMLAAEGALLAAVGAAAGLVCGAAISLVLVYVVNRQSFNWSIELHPPFMLLASLVLVLLTLAVVTAILSAREAMGMGPVRAVREDW
ncbi:MAG TPA: FtsX-like permease family protein [Burkholderiales bacterium]|nr:FtsX-like permease family protein [Burkholderiales bacterium]